MESEQTITKVINEISNLKDNEAMRKNFKKRGNVFIETVKFLSRRNDCMMYGGSAINSLLPASKKIYPANEIPDYDIFVKDDKTTAKELAEYLVSKKFSGVAVGKGLHGGTSKVFAEGVAVADMTSVPVDAFRMLWKNRVKGDNGIMSVHPDFIFHTMFRILSQPFDASFRWQKTFSRMKVLSSVYKTNSRFTFDEPINIDHHRKVFDVAKKMGCIIGGSASIRYAQTGRLVPTGGWLTIYTANPVGKVGTEFVKNLRSLGLKDTTSSRVKNCWSLPSHMDINTGGIMFRICSFDECRSIVATKDGVSIASAMTELMHLSGEHMFDTSTDRVKYLNMDAIRRFVLRLKSEKYLVANCIGTHVGLATQRMKQRR